jgi:hypothetical protein
MEQKTGQKKDYFRAIIEADELVMEPHCSCGTHLEEEYFCEKCQKQCTCTEIRCVDEETLEYINKLLHNNASFRNFTAVLEQHDHE